MPDISKDEYIRRERAHDDEKKTAFLKRYEKEKGKQSENTTNVKQPSQHQEDKPSRFEDIKEKFGNVGNRIRESAKSTGEDIKEHVTYKAREATGRLSDDELDTKLQRLKKEREIARAEHDIAKYRSNRENYDHERYEQRTEPEKRGLMTFSNVDVLEWAGLKRMSDDEPSGSIKGTPEDFLNFTLGGGGVSSSKVPAHSIDMDQYLNMSLGRTKSQAGISPSEFLSMGSKSSMKSNSADSWDNILKGFYSM